MLHYIQRRSNPKERKTEYQTLELILKLLPLVSGYIVFIGTATQIVYYLRFNIKILEFVSLGEALLFGLQYLYILALLILAQAMAPLLASCKKYELFGESKSKLPPAFGLFFWSIVTFLLLYLLGMIFINPINSHDPNHYPTWIFIVAVLLGMTLTVLAQRFLDQTRGILVLVLAFTFAIICLSFGEAGRIKKLPQQRAKVFTFKSYKIITTDSLVYVGKVEKYFFFYNKKLDGPEIYSTEDFIFVK